MSSSANVYTMPSGVPFLPSLAAGLKDMFGPRLEDALILLPTRRAVRMLGDAFVGATGASLLPRMRTLADIDPEEPPFEPGYLTGLVSPAMPPSQRRFELAQLIAHYHRQVSELPLDPSGMLALTDPLLAILDDAALEEVTLSGLIKLKEIEDFAAQHFQQAATLYKIIQEYWPKHVESLGLMEPMARRVALLNALTDLWSETPPDHPVVIAGSTGTLRASARLMRCVAHMKDGLIVLPGLDKRLTEKSWDMVGPEHPQNSLKKLISVIGIKREDVPHWHQTYDLTDPIEARRRVISESLVPAGDTADWPARIKILRTNFPSGDIFETGLHGLSVIEARTEEEEALTIALMMRETLAAPEKTAALITPDPALARRVKARLRRWDVDVDYSQGEPLEETQAGSFLAGILKLAEDPESPVDLAFMSKHPLTALGLQQGAAQTSWNSLELSSYRGVRPKVWPEGDLLSVINAALASLTTGADSRLAPDWTQALIAAAESFAADNETPGAETLWRGEAGETAASLLTDMVTFAEPLGEMTLAEFSRLLSTLMRGRVVRPRYGTHPRLQILGPLEARMIEADRIILGGLNEGVWPAGTPALPFLSRGMRQVLGLSLPERRFGLAAHDFAELASNPEVIFIRAARSDDSPRVASRWLWRLQALVRGAMGANSGALNSSLPYLEWARAIDHVPADKVEPAISPAPKPPLEARWPKERKLSVTEVRRWIRDPYSIYAKHVLGLEPLGGLDETLGAREYGSAIHQGLEVFSKDHKGIIPKDAERLLAQSFETALIEAGYPEHHLSKERVRLARAADDMTAWMRQRRAAGWQYVRAENYGRVEIDELGFTLSSYADLIEKSAEGYAVVDYKTGSPASEKEVKAGFDPQLPLTALMLSRGGFDNVPAGKTAQLLYVRVRGSGDGCEAKFITSPENKNGSTAQEYADDALHILTELVRAFDDPDTPYPSQPRIQYVNDYGDYDDLARRGEWAKAGDGQETGGGQKQ